MPLNEHSAMIRSMEGCNPVIGLNRFGKGIHAIFAEMPGRSPSTRLASVRFDKDLHSATEAREWLRSEGLLPLLFEIAENEGKRSDDERDMIREGITPDLTCRAFTIRADSIDEEKRTVNGIIATENPVSVFDFARFEPIDEVLLVDGLRTPEQVPLLDSHNRFGVDNVLGATRNFKRERVSDLGNVLSARNDFDSDDRSVRAFNKVVSGSVRDFSIGYRVTAFAEIEPNESAKIGGRKFTAGQRMLRVSVRADVKENSLVPIGADPAAKVRNTGVEK